MKPQINLATIVVGIVLCLVLFTHCRDHQPVNQIKITNYNGIPKDSIEAYEGAIGFIISTRNIAKKGYQPAQAKVEVKAIHGNYSQTIPIDEYTNMGQLSIPQKGLTAAAKEELKEGVLVNIEVLDTAENTIITTNLGQLFFESNPAVKELNATTLTAINDEIILDKHSAYYLQQVEANGTPLNKAFLIFSGFASFKNVATTGKATFGGDEPRFSLSFVPIPNEKNVFAIRLKSSGKYVRFDKIPHETIFGQTAYNQTAYLSNYTSLTKIQKRKDYNDFKFSIKKLNDYRLKVGRFIHERLKSFLVLLNQAKSCLENYH